MQTEDHWLTDTFSSKDKYNKLFIGNTVLDLYTKCYINNIITVDLSKTVKLLTL